MRLFGQRAVVARVVAGAAALVLLTASSASANESNVSGEVLIDHGSTVVHDYDPGGVSASPACNPDGTSCTVYLTLNQRDYNRFVRWCGSTFKVIIIPAGSTAEYTECLGPSSWAIIVWGRIDTTNTNDVHVGVNVQT